jgi:hypothetical protein
MVNPDNCWLITENENRRFSMKRLIWNKHTKLVLKHAVGWLCIAAGIIMIVTPGQGILTILLGIYLLADEIPLFGRIKARLHDRFPRAADFVHRKGEQIRAKLHMEKKSPRKSAEED